MAGKENVFHKYPNKYFIETTKQLLSYLETDFALPLTDQKFISFFQDWCQKHRIKEHYLIDKYGNLQLIDEAGKKFYFIIHTDRTLNNLIELHHEDKETMLFIRAVQQREKIPFFGEGVEGWELPSYQWTTCFYVPKMLIGTETYYWAVAEAA